MKYRSVRTYSELCKRWFASKAECRRGEALALMEKEGVVSNLIYQHKFSLCLKPRISITVDFAYIIDGKTVYEDTKGVLTRDFRTKMAWVKEKYDIDIQLNLGGK